MADYGWQALANISSQRPLRGLIMAGKGDNIIPKALRRLIMVYKGLNSIPRAAAALEFG